MAKRKPAALEDGQDGGTPKKQKQLESAPIPQDVAPSPSALETPSKTRSILKRGTSLLNGDATPKSLRKVLFTQPATPLDLAESEPTQDSPLTAARNADHSARRKSARRLIAGPEELDEDGEAIDEDDALAEEILDEDEGQDENGLETIAVAQETPTKGGKIRGRPKGKRRVRSPTPPQDLPPHELYFFQNRPGGSKTSTNTLSSNLLLSHEDYFEHIEAYKDPHEADREHLKSLHMHSFEQWIFELQEGFSICLYGYGSKRELVMDYADFLHESSPKKPIIIIVNGYTSTLTLKDILTTVANNVLPKSQLSKLPAQPAPLLDLITSHLMSNPATPPTYLFIHSIDALPLRKGPTQTALARLASQPNIQLVATADTLNFPLMWDISLRTQYRFLFHDTTTFAPYTAEIDVVDEVNALLGRSGRRVGGKDGVSYVLRSLPENARSLFRILVAEQLALADADGVDGGAFGGDDDEDEDGLLGFDDENAMDVEPDTPSKTKRGRKAKKAAPKAPAPVRTVVEGIEYRTLYHKAVEEFVCSSEMGFRTLLKEFHDHEMIESRKDGLGTERLSVPFSRAELEGLLEELV